MSDTLIHTDIISCKYYLMRISSILLCYYLLYTETIVVALHSYDNTIHLSSTRKNESTSSTSTAYTSTGGIATTDAKIWSSIVEKKRKKTLLTTAATIDSDMERMMKTNVSKLSSFIHVQSNRSNGSINRNNNTMNRNNSTMNNTMNKNNYTMHRNNNTMNRNNNTMNRNNYTMNRNNNTMNRNNNTMDKSNNQKEPLVVPVMIDTRNSISNSSGSSDNKDINQLLETIASLPSSSTTSSKRFFNMSIITWNMGEIAPSEEDCASFIRAYRNNDIVVFGLQECEDIRLRRQEGHRSRKWKAIQSHCLGSQFVNLCHHKMGGLMLNVYCKKRIKKMITGIQLFEVACGVGNVLTNKGAVGLVLRLHDNTTLGLINVHLAAHVKKVTQRNNDYHRILTTFFDRIPSNWLKKPSLSLSIDDNDGRDDGDKRMNREDSGIRDMRSSGRMNDNIHEGRSSKQKQISGRVDRDIMNSIGWSSSSRSSRVGSDSTGFLSSYSRVDIRESVVRSSSFLSDTLKDTMSIMSRHANGHPIYHTNKPSRRSNRGSRGSSSKKTTTKEDEEKYGRSSRSSSSSSIRSSSGNRNRTRSKRSQKSRKHKIMATPLKRKRRSSTSVQLDYVDDSHENDGSRHDVVHHHIGHDVVSQQDSMVLLSKEQEQLRMLQSIDSLIIFGDFNYRIDAPRLEIELFHDLYRKHYADNSDDDATDAVDAAAADDDDITSTVWSSSDVLHDSSDNVKSKRVDTKEKLQRSSKSPFFSSSSMKGTTGSTATSSTLSSTVSRPPNSRRRSTVDTMKAKHDNRYLRRLLISLNNNNDSTVLTDDLMRQKKKMMMLHRDIAELLLCDQLRREQSRGML